MLRFFFRIFFVVLGLFMIYYFGGSATNTVLYRLNGGHAQGEIIGFKARKGKAIIEDDTYMRKGKTRARRPVFRFLAATQTDSITVSSNSAVLFSFSQFVLHEKVTVVYNTERPEQAHIFSFQILLTQLFAVLFAMVLIAMGVSGKG